MARSVERTGDALWPWAERLQPAIAWLRAAGYLVEAGRGGGSVPPPGDSHPQGPFFGNDPPWDCPGRSE